MLNSVKFRSSPANNNNNVKLRPMLSKYIFLDLTDSYITIIMPSFTYHLRD